MHSHGCTDREGLGAPPFLNLPSPRGQAFRIFPIYPFRCVVVVNPAIRIVQKSTHRYLQIGQILVGEICRMFPYGRVEESPAPFRARISFFHIPLCRLDCGGFSRLCHISRTPRLDVAANVSRCNSRTRITPKQVDPIEIGSTDEALTVEWRYAIGRTMSLSGIHPIRKS